MKKLILIILISISVNINAENYKKVKIHLSNANDIQQLQRLGLPLDDSYINRDGSLELFVNEREFNSLAQTSIMYSVLIEDWQAHYKNNLENGADKFNPSKLQSQYNLRGFTYGSMGGFYTLEEVWQKVDEMIQNYPNIISTKDSIGSSEEGRPIYALRISDNPNNNEEEPEVLYTSLHHAREPESMMQMIYYMLYLLENYGKDAEVTYLVDNREMYFIPVVNPDGYFYNQTTNPDGGGMWRKNRQYNLDGSYGVDLNRNYGFEWGYDDNGSSSSPSSSTYRGRSAFSEKETETIRQFCIAHDIKLALNYHSYSNLLITPWGYIPEHTPDSVFYKEIATDMTQYNNYVWGFSAQIIYAVNGDSDDWFYGEQTEKNKIFAMTPEVGNNNDGFWPDQDRIVPLAEENIYPNLYLAWVAGGFVNTLNINYDKQYYSASDTGNVTLTLKNKGLADISDIRIVSTISNNASILEGESFDAGIINSQSEVELESPVKFKIMDSAVEGDSVILQFEYYSSDLLLSTDTYSFFVGVPNVIFADYFDNVDNWTLSSNSSKSWETTENNFYSSPKSLTDSKNGDYLSNTKSSITTTNGIDLSSIKTPFLKFRTKYSIEAGWDYGQVLISTDSSNWVSIGGKLSKIGSGSFQPSDQLVYDGLAKEWITEIININDYSGKQIFIKFELNSDEYVEEDGWYIDDLEIYEYANSIVSVNGKIIESPDKYVLFQNYPNPFNPSTTIKYSIPVEPLRATALRQVTLKIYDILGREVATLVNKQQKAGNYEVVFDGIKLSSGIYFYRLQCNGFVENKKMILVK